MIIKTVPIDSIHLYPGNPREIEESQFNKRSLRCLQVNNDSFRKSRIG